MVNLSPVAQRTNAFTNGVVDRPWIVGREFESHVHHEIFQTHSVQVSNRSSNKSSNKYSSISSTPSVRDDYSSLADTSSVITVYQVDSRNNDVIYWTMTGIHVVPDRQQYI